MSKQTIPEFGTGVVIFYIEGEEHARFVDRPTLMQIGERWFAIGRIPAIEGEMRGQFALAWDTVTSFAVPDEGEDPLGELPVKK